MPLFLHEPLDLRNPEVRLFLILPELSDGLLQCQIIHFDLDRPLQANFDRAEHPNRRIKWRASVEFAALSYCWGNPTPTHRILVNEQDFMVRHNLWLFLHYARGALKQLLWVDQLCIDQNNVAERNHQVLMMPSIYGSAAEVIVFVGQMGNDSELVMKHLVNPAQPGFRRTDLQWSEACRFFLTRDYWTRLWVIQEIILARQILLMCGETIVPVELRTISSLAVECPREDSEYSAAQLWPVRLAFQEGSLDTRSVYGLSKQKCHDVRDKVFGLQSLIPEPLRVTIDYTKEPSDILLEVLRKLDSEFCRPRFVSGPDGVYHFKVEHETLSLICDSRSRLELEELGFDNIAAIMLLPCQERFENDPSLMKRAILEKPQTVKEMPEDMISMTSEDVDGHSFPINAISEIIVWSRAWGSHEMRIQAQDIEALFLELQVQVNDFLMKEEALKAAIAAAKWVISGDADSIPPLASADACDNLSTLLLPTERFLAARKRKTQGRSETESQLLRNRLQNMDEKLSTYRQEQQE